MVRILAPNGEAKSLVASTDAMPTTPPGSNASGSLSMSTGLSCLSTPV
jgi:hypothetical protein